ncbi:MAG: 5-formyltetrahydrofolate cyclo-ligase [Erysipelotrichaceae bacterium]
MDNASIRSKFIEKRVALSDTERATLSCLISKKVDQALVGKQHVGIYCAFLGEPNIVLGGDKILYAPRIIGNEMEFVRLDGTWITNRFGILEPAGAVIATHLDAIVVPLVCFDDHNQRLGMGKGFYDRFLSNYDGLKIGVGYHFQKYNGFKKNSWDIPMDCVITDV